MTKIITMEEIRTEALTRFDILLISTKKVPIVEKMLWKDNKTGVYFYRSWHNLRKGQLTPFNPSEKLDIEDIRKEALSKYGLELLTENYTKAVTKMKWRDIETGNVFWRRWSSIKEGHTQTYNINDYEKDKKFIESYKNLGYRYDSTKEEYLNYKSEHNKKVLIEHPLLDRPWSTTIANFKKRAESYLNREGMSWGENVISSILSYNKIKFISQYRVIIKGNIHKFDFYLPSYDTYIEYDGRQHYEPINYWGGESIFSERCDRDKEKDEYVSDMSSTLIRIPYTIKEPQDFIKILSKEFGRTLDLSASFLYKGSYKEIAKFYSKNSRVETMNKFNVSKTTVTKAFKIVYGMTKREYLKKGGK